MSKASPKTEGRPASRPAVPRAQDDRIVKESARTEDRDEAERFLRDRLDSRDDGSLAAIQAGKKLTFDEWCEWFLERRSKPPYRSEQTHEGNLVIIKTLSPVFGSMRLQEITAELIERYLDDRLHAKRRIHTKFGIRLGGALRPAGVHREFRVLRRILNVAVQQKLLAANPCQAVEFPVRLTGSTRKPHYMTASEQERILLHAPSYLRNVIVIMVEMGLRPYRELLRMKQEHVDLANETVHVAGSKTPGGIADMPMTGPAKQAFAAQLAEAKGAEYLFPSPRHSQRPYISNVRKAWKATLKHAGVEYFALYELRHNSESWIIPSWQWNLGGARTFGRIVLGIITGCSGRPARRHRGGIGPTSLVLESSWPGPLTSA